MAFLYFRGGAGTLGDGTLSASREAHARIVEAVLDRDAASASRRMRRHLEAESAFLQNRKLSRQVMPRSVALGGGVSNKRAEDVARAILQDIVADDLPPGTLLGSQAALIEHTPRVGRSSAGLRLLEHHQIAAMRRGPGGGLFVSAPSVRGVSDVVAVYLARRVSPWPTSSNCGSGWSWPSSSSRSTVTEVTSTVNYRTPSTNENRLSVAEFADGGTTSTPSSQRWPATGRWSWCFSCSSA